MQVGMTLAYLIVCLFTEMIWVVSFAKFVNGTRYIRKVLLQHGMKHAHRTARLDRIKNKKRTTATRDDCNPLGCFGSAFG